MHIFVNNYAHQRDIPLFFAAGKEEKILSAIKTTVQVEADEALPTGVTNSRKSQTKDISAIIRRLLTKN